MSQAPEVKSSWRWLPNFFTLVRLALIPVFVHFFLGGQIKLATWILASAYLTDMVDGFLARKLNVTSVLGANLDTGVDFVLNAAVIFMLTYAGMYPLWLLLVLTGCAFALNITEDRGRLPTNPIWKPFGATVYAANLMILVFRSQIVIVGLAVIGSAMAMWSVVHAIRFGKYR
ncbi:MAG: CDP-alcohol phosphatidyltransferase family protein [Candidatus Altiarchaeota archaeon]|nr:CDP-alcohol phosphatidyltransferase family protein [Candidatus Altiarchaeota archaeon]